MNLSGSGNLSDNRLGVLVGWAREVVIEGLRGTTVGLVPWATKGVEAGVFTVGTAKESARCSLATAFASLSYSSDINWD